MVERKLSDPASREYWAKVEEISKSVANLPSWMKGGSGSSAEPPSKDSANKKEAKKS